MMKLNLGFKISLLVITILIIVFLLMGMFMVLFIQNSKFEWSMMIPFIIVFSGFLGLIYQVKTLKYYKDSRQKHEITGRFFWLGNLLFSISIFGISLFVLYSLYPYTYFFNSGIRIEYLIPLIFFVVCLITGIVLAIEQSSLYRRILNFENTHFEDSIDDIKGHQGEKLD